MTRFRRRTACESARSWAALAPDGELSEFELASLETHLVACAPCARFAVQAERLALAVRESDLVVPSRSFGRPVSASRRRAVLARARPAFAAAAVAAMAVGVASRAPLAVDPREAVQETTTAAHTSVAAPDDGRAEQEALRRQQLNIFASDIELTPLPTSLVSRPI